MVDFRFVHKVRLELSTAAKTKFIVFEKRLFAVALSRLIKLCNDGSVMMTLKPHPGSPFNVP